jgi:CDP-diacylglycerol---glycerol-3-phosphate 3-phosphatidyltransferase
MPTSLPNRLSFLRILLSPVFLLLFVSSNPTLRLLSVAVFLIAAITDWYDGVIARRNNAVTETGKFLDPLADKVLTSAAFIAFAWTDHVAWWMVIVIIVRDILITLLRSLAEFRDVHIVTSKTAQWKTFIQMVVLYYLLVLIVASGSQWVLSRFPSLPKSLLDPGIVFALMLGVTLLTLFTGVQYLYDNRQFTLGLLGIRRRAVD